MSQRELHEHLAAVAQEISETGERQTVLPEEFKTPYMRMGGHGNSSYKPEYTQMLIEYSGVASMQEIEEIKIRNGKEVTITTEVQAFCPTIAGFCSIIGVSKKGFMAWVRAENDEDKPKYPELVEAYEYHKAQHERVRIENTDAGNYHPAFSKFIMVNNLDGYTDDEAGNKDVQTVIMMPADQSASNWEASSMAQQAQLKEESKS